MATQLDVYRDWLGIADKTRPLNYYQLLRLKTFEDDLAKIREHYRRMNSHVRKYSTGDYMTQSQELLNELARAMLCLTDVQRKREYDASLGRKEFREGERRTLEDILLGDKIIDRDQLSKARYFSDATGLELRDAVVQQKLASQEAVMQAFAESIGIPYIQIEDLGVDQSLLQHIPPNIARQHSCLPVLTDGEILLMASPHPLDPMVEEDLRLRTGMIVRPVLCTQASISPLIAQYYPRDAVGPAASAAGRPGAAPVKQRPVLTPEESLRRRKMMAVVGFNVTVILFMIFAVLRHGGQLHLVEFWNFLVAVTLGAGVALGAYFYAGR